MSMVKITASVGVGGANRAEDIRTIQRAINAQLARLTPLAPLKVDGSLGRTPVHSKTVFALMEYQRRVLGAARPSGRVDPDDATLRMLNQLHTLAQPSSPARAQAPKVTYSPQLPLAKQIVSEYAKGVIRIALSRAGMPQAVITSTLRTPAEQAGEMYKNAKKGLAAQFRLYGPTGDKVLRVFEENQTQPEAEVVQLMTDKIAELLKNGSRTSKHCTTDSDYRFLNIIDIGLNSTRAMCGTAMNVAGLTKAFSDLHKEGYIEKLIDETKKTNSCWHIEVRPGKKPLPS